MSQLDKRTGQQSLSVDILLKSTLVNNSEKKIAKTIAKAMERGKLNAGSQQV